ncbi:uncharacterized protein LOC141751311 [Larus michahellis]|uniref:uncharacterized protein LOC141751311 n=1 Tax=Larus michahellis TaxID=119627 RepID=UPI003D9BFC71
MDSPRFKTLWFLLLTIAALRPNTAMPSGNPAETTQDSSSGNTSVTVYHCEDCEIEACEPSNYEGFAIIAKTQNEKFSNKAIQLRIYETSISMCFQQENTSYKGIYAIFWENDRGLGDSCGIVNSGASSASVSGSITKICCTAQINFIMSRSSLECYLSEKTGKSTADIPDEGNLDDPQLSVDEKSSIGIITTILILGACGAVLATYCVRQNRNGQADRKNKLLLDMKNFTSIWKRSTNGKTMPLFQQHTPQ